MTGADRLTVVEAALNPLGCRTAGDHDRRRAEAAGRRDPAGRPRSPNGRSGRVRRPVDPVVHHVGHQFQVDPNPAATTSTNWYAYDYGTLDYDLRVDVELAEAWACQAEDMGFQADAPATTASRSTPARWSPARLVDPDRSRPIALVSCNLYAAAGDLNRIAEAAARAAGEARPAGRLRGHLPACPRASSSAGSSRPRTASNAGHDAWNRRVLDLLAAGRLQRRSTCASNMRAKRRRTASSGRWPSWPAAAPATARARVLGTAVWGTGAAVATWLDGT